MTSPKTQKQLSLENRLKSYERVENALRDFFSSTNFCYEHCFSEEEASIGFNSLMQDIIVPGKEGCCHNKYTKLYFFDKGMMGYAKKTIEFEKKFQKEQFENIKPNFEQQGTCGYHTEKGCAIEKFRSPICNSWVCWDYEIYLSNKFNINYSGKSYSDNIVKSLLSSVYGERINHSIINKTISNLKKATKRIKEHVPGQKYEKNIQI